MSYKRQGDIDTREIRRALASGKIGQGLWLGHVNLVAMTARYITHWFLYLKHKSVIVLHMQKKKGKSLNIVPDLALTDHQSVRT